VKPLFFVHIQKTSGTSVNHILKSQNKEVWYRRRTQNKPDIIIGHYPFGLHKELGIDDCSYMTFFRDPIDRWKSQVRHGLTRHKKESYCYYRYSKCGQNMTKFMEWCINYDAGCNVMTKQLAGCEIKTNIHRWNRDLGLDKDFGYYQIYGLAGRYYPYTRQEMADMFELAKENLVKHFDFVGFQDDSINSQKKMCEHFGFTYDGPIRENISKKKEKVDWERPKLKILINEINRYDLELYKFASENLR
jgi:hypothetical protein